MDLRHQRRETKPFNPALGPSYPSGKHNKLVHEHVVVVNQKVHFYSSLMSPTSMTLLVTCDCLRLLRDFKKTSLKIARFRNNLRFNLTCVNSHVTPKYVTLNMLNILPNPIVKGYKAQNITKKAERALPNERICQTNFTFDILKRKHRVIEQKLRAELTEVDFRKVSEFTELKQRAEHEVMKSGQIRKFERLKDVREKTVNSVKKCRTTYPCQNIEDPRE